MPEFAVTAVTPEGESLQGLPQHVDVRVHNGGFGWEAAGAAPLIVQAMWDGPRGVGQEAATTTISALPAGGVAEVRLTLKAPLDETNRPRRLIVTVNPTQTVGEQSASDNTSVLELGGLRAPQGLQVTTRAGSSIVTLNWAAAEDSRVVGYRIYRLNDQGLEPVGSSFGSSWVDLNAKPGQRLRYVVSSFSSDMVESSPGGIAEATLQAATGGRYAAYLPLVRR